MPRPNECPRCGAYVGQFAAGCSVCGSDLARLRHRPRRPRITVPHGASELLEGGLLTLLMVVVAVLAPLYGMALAALVFFDRRRRGDRTMQNLAGASFVLGLLAFFVPGLGQVGPLGS